MLHNFDGPFYMKNEKYMKNMIAITFFHVFLIFRVVGSIESMQHGYSDVESNQVFHVFFIFRVVGSIKRM